MEPSQIIETSATAAFESRYRKNIIIFNAIAPVVRIYDLRPKLVSFNDFTFELSSDVNK